MCEKRERNGGRDRRREGEERDWGKGGGKRKRECHIRGEENVKSERETEPDSLLLLTTRTEGSGRPRLVSDDTWVNGTH